MHIREPRLQDGSAVHELVRSSPPLDLNSQYAYFLGCSHFHDTCALAEADDGATAGFLLGYRRPDAADVLFVWQVVTGSAWRGQGLAPRLLEHILARPANSGVRWVEATVGPSNTASKGFFRSFAERRGSKFEEKPFLSEADFGGGDHEAEVLLRIGPLA